MNDTTGQEIRDELREIEATIKNATVDVLSDLRGRQREQTAATILAALTTDRMAPDIDSALDDADMRNVRYARMLTDALCAELAKAGAP